jgi:hypothetical protein
MQIVQINESPLLVKMNPLARKTDVSYSQYLFSVEVNLNFLLLHKIFIEMRLRLMSFIN